MEHTGNGTLPINDPELLSHFQTLQITAEQWEREKNWERALIPYQLMVGVINLAILKNQEKQLQNEDYNLKMMLHRYYSKLEEVMQKNLSQQVSTIFAQANMSPQYKFSCPKPPANIELFQKMFSQSLNLAEPTTVQKHPLVNMKVERQVQEDRSAVLRNPSRIVPTDTVKPVKVEQPSNVDYVDRSKNLRNRTADAPANNVPPKSVSFQQITSRRPTRQIIEEDELVPPRVVPNQDNSQDEEQYEEEKKGPFQTARQKLVSDGAAKGQPTNYKGTKTTKKAVGGGKRKFTTPFKKKEEEEAPPPTTKKSKVDDQQAVIDTMMEDERMKGIAREQVEMILSDILDRSPKVDWDDIAGLDFAKSTVTEMIILPLLRPDIFTGMRAPPRGMLLFGPPGTGKTMIGKAIASKSNSTFFSISASSLTSKWIGEGEKMVKTLFAVARYLQPSVIFIDEIDSLLTQRSDTENEASRRIKTEFLVQFDGARTDGQTDRILLIGATNRPQELDDAARRRLVKRLYIPLPDFAARKALIKHLTSTLDSAISEEEYNEISRKTDGYSGADIHNLVQEASYFPVREGMSSMDITQVVATELRPVALQDFESSMDRVKPSVSQADLKVYQEWNKTFGTFHEPTTKRTTATC